MAGFQNYAGNVELRRTPYTKFRGRAFYVAGQATWNNVPDHIKLCTTLGSFKRQLKSNLFSISFPM